MACLSPIGIKNPKKLKHRFEGGKNAPETFWTSVPCGKCPPCLKARSNAWAFRLNRQRDVSDSALFVTFTYNTEHVPITENGFMSLQKKDFQDFMKRLRKLHPQGKSIKYYAVGEYGSSSDRPHFHAIMFNVLASEENYALIQEAWKCTKDRCTEIATSWKRKEQVANGEYKLKTCGCGGYLGDVHVGDVQGASINYTTKYIHKGSKVPKHKRDDREKEKSLSSMKLGANYLTPQMVAWHQADLSRNYVVHPDGWKSALPRYYKQKIFDGYQVRQMRPIMENMVNEAEQKRQQAFKNRTGSLEGYERAVHESNKAQFENFYAKESEKRRTI
ncbi:replication initiation protein [Tortoise microvirus 29]|nr:replication initiation protein [Tortoise microvirus 29]